MMAFSSWADDAAARATTAFTTHNVRGLVARLDSRTASFVVLTVLLILSLAMCTPHNVSLRYKLTYEVLVEDETWTASGVMEMNVYESRGAGGFELKGEAIPINLGEGRYLFSTLIGGDSVKVDGWNAHALHAMSHDKLLMAAFQDYMGPSLVESFRLLKEQRHAVDVSVRVLPKLYLSSDVKDPESLMAVKPEDLSDLGIKISRVSIAVTDDPVTRGPVLHLLPWLYQLGGVQPVARDEFTR